MRGWVRKGGVPVGKSYPAHIRENGGVMEEQSVKEHCENVAGYSGEAMGWVGEKDKGGMKNAGYLAGLIHDCGKYSDEFAAYLRAAVKGNGPAKGSVIHSFAAVRMILEEYHRNPSQIGYPEITAELIAYAAGSHHGLFDCNDENKESGFEHRLGKQPGIDKEAIERFRNECADKSKIDDLFKKATEEVTAVSQAILKMCQGRKGHENDEMFFYMQLLGRMLTSAIMDADRRDTAEYMDGTDYMSLPNADEKLWRECEQSLAVYLGAKPTGTQIADARKELSQICEDFAVNRPGIYRLNIETGGGKTLSGLRYALKHAIKHDKRRIIIAAPMLSILTQNAEVIREAVGNNSIVLEHHSNIIKGKMRRKERDRYELLAETWNAPIVITTMVQFLNALFDGDTGSIRRCQAICGSVIILDEVQDVPFKMLSLFNLAINFLAGICNCTIILCSATQPALETTDHPIAGIPANVVAPLDAARFHSIFKRTELIDGGQMTIEQTAGFAQRLMSDYSSCLIVANTKKCARTLYRLLHKTPGVSVFFMSADMCMAHRLDVIKQMKSIIESGEKVLCVSTQVMEAGVDISFASGIRIIAGIENAVQTAGRVNRSGEYGATAPVYIIRCTDESLFGLDDIRSQRTACTHILCEASRNPAKYGGGLDSNEAIADYFHYLYKSMPLHAQDYVTPDRSTTLYSLLTENNQYCSTHAAKSYLLRHAARTAGSIFSVYDTDQITVLVPYRDGARIISDLRTATALPDIYRLLEEAKPYCISLYPNRFNRLLASSIISPICDGNIFVLSSETLAWEDD